MISRLIIISCCLAVLSSRLMAVGIMVNEYRNGTGTVGTGTKMARDEYIEFVITENTSSATLASLTFGDSNDATSALQGVFSFDKATLDAALGFAHLNEFLPGTILVVKGVNLGAQQLDYDPLNGGWTIEFVAGQGAKDHAETLINSNISIGNNGDVVWISTDSPPARNTDTSGIIHAIGHDNAPGLIANTVAAAFGSENILTSNVPTGRSVANMGGITESLAAPTTDTMGAANGGANTAWITGMQTASTLAAAPEPTQTMLLAMSFCSLVLKRHRKGADHV